MSKPGEAFDWDLLMRFGLGALGLAPKDFWRMTPRELEAAMTAATPKAAARQSKKDPLESPKTETVPAMRPCPRERATANIIPGPGAAPTAKEARRKVLKAGQAGSRSKKSTKR